MAALVHQHLRHSYPLPVSGYRLHHGQDSVSRWHAGHSHCLHCRHPAAQCGSFHVQVPQKARVLEVRSTYACLRHHHVSPKSMQVRRTLARRASGHNWQQTALPSDQGCHATHFELLRRDKLLSDRVCLEQSRTPFYRAADNQAHRHEGNHCVNKEEVPQRR